MLSLIFKYCAALQDFSSDTLVLWVGAVLLWWSFVFCRGYTHIHKLLKVFGCAGDLVELSTNT